MLQWKGFLKKYHGLPVVSMCSTIPSLFLLVLLHFFLRELCKWFKEMVQNENLVRRRKAYYLLVHRNIKRKKVMFLHVLCHRDTVYKSYQEERDLEKKVIWERFVIVFMIIICKWKTS
ncbi:hypothetical protein CEXT_529331 [Caerostris extrusa]|uniref:Uncharacterized protein n=1 Tax=Caerostris extrusa TaxID=172846 RepID=A0AAV4RYS8_CAEEX|nr:hypothetical protein CEXT_529331 [Caerostris extrusa]